MDAEYKLIEPKTSKKITAANNQGRHSRNSLL
ncbi:unnamed protein product, partial [marine sediment metagenome]